MQILPRVAEPASLESDRSRQNLAPNAIESFDSGTVARSVFSINLTFRCRNFTTTNDGPTSKPKANMGFQ
jgi:hypothetical protein